MNAVLAVALMAFMMLFLHGRHHQAPQPPPDQAEARKAPPSFPDAGTPPIAVPGPIRRSTAQDMEEVPVVATRPALPRPASNGRCPVLGNPVADRNQTITVEGRRYYICCDDCAQKLAADPGRYLDSDGTPKNARQSASGEKIRDSY